MSKQYEINEHPQHGYKRVTPSPTEAEIEKYYLDEFYSQEYKRFNDSDLVVQQKDLEFFESVWERILDNFTGLSADQRVAGKTLLDIGCGWGLALAFFQKKGLLVHGVDPSPAAVKYALSRGLNVRQSGIRDLNHFIGTKFDYLTLMNVLEHIDNPEEYLKMISRSLMSSTSILAIDVPNEYNDFQLAGMVANRLNPWWLAIPQHLNYFNLKSLTKVVEYAGMEVIYAHSSFPLEMFLLMGDDYVSDPILGKIAHEKRCKFEHSLKEYDGGVKLKEFYYQMAQLGLGRQVTVYARKVIKK